MTMPGAAIPKVIYALWLDQDCEEIPLVARTCLARWQVLNPDFKLCILDRADVIDLLADFPVPLELMTVQALSDVVRARLLSEKGGIWVDASVLPVRPLGDWLAQASGAAGFFAFDGPAADRPIASWFLASEPGHPIMRLWWQEVLSYWNKSRNLLIDPRDGNPIPPSPVWEVSPDGGAQGNTFPYFWFHYLFARLLETNAEFAASWETCPKISAVPPHMLQKLCRQQPAPPRAAITTAIGSSLVQKLDWRAAYPFDSIQQCLADL